MPTAQQITDARRTVAQVEALIDEVLHEIARRLLADIAVTDPDAEQLTRTAATLNRTRVRAEFINTLPKPALTHKIRTAYEVVAAEPATP
ncbi:hypothetical protein [Parafrankia discariae]|uniref:hypothetical protein n=1 Tax=Parafrankia discariae TaxID=365528 RepID=UPI000381B2A1|nr:hypothetical protein [Parafrankia discariae]